jgi:hypothetical protein
MIELPVERHPTAHEAELLARPDDDLLGEAREMHAQRAAISASSAKSRSETQSSELAIGRSKPSAFAVMCGSIGKAGAGQRRRAQRAFVHPRARIGKARTIAAEHLDIGHQVMAQSHRLRVCRWVKPGIMDGRMLVGARRPGALQARSIPLELSIASRTHRRKSVAT